MKDGEHYDFVIIGTGAGGGTLAWKPAPSGKRILLPERGPYVPREKDNWSPRAVNAEGKYNTKEIWRDKDNNELHAHTNYYVGGNTKFYGAALSACVRPTSVKSLTTACISPPGRFPTTNSNRTTLRLSDFTTHTV